MMTGDGWLVPLVSQEACRERPSVVLRSRWQLELTLKPTLQLQPLYANESRNVQNTGKQGVKMSVDQKQSSLSGNGGERKGKKEMMWVNKPEQHRPPGSKYRAGSLMQGWVQVAQWPVGSQKEADCLWPAKEIPPPVWEGKTVPAILEPS